MQTPHPVQPKLLYLTRRNPAFPRAAWTPRWRAHGALGMSLPRWVNVARYAHVDLAEPREHQRAYLSDHDGIGLIWHRSIAHRDAHFADKTSQATMVSDEHETFARPIALDCCSAREQVLLPPPVAGSAVRLFLFLWVDFALQTPPEARGHVRNLPLPPTSVAGWGLDCTAIEEFWFDDAAAADRAARELSAIETSVLCIGRETELYRRPD